LYSNVFVKALIGNTTVKQCRCYISNLRGSRQTKPQPPTNESNKVATASATIDKTSKQSSNL